MAVRIDLPQEAITDFCCHRRITGRPSLFCRKVNLVERCLVERSKNSIRRNHILSHLERIYVA